MKFYTDTVSKELLDALVKKGYPYKTIPTDYRTLYDENGVLVGGYQEYGTVFPSYADVLDWLLNKQFEINIFKDSANKFTGIADNMNNTIIEEGHFVSLGEDIESTSFKETIEKAILLCLDFIDIPDNSGDSCSISI